MAKAGVTYDDVALVANQMIADGTNVTWRAVRVRLGDTGSSVTISKHLKSWRAAQPPVIAEAKKLPEALTDALAKEIEKAGAMARVDIEKQLSDARDEIESLRGEGEQFEKDMEGLAAQVQALTTERDQLIGRGDAQALEIESIKSALMLEQAKVEAARLELATQLVRHEQAQKTEHSQELEIDRLRALADLASAERIASQQSTAVAIAKLEAMQERALKAEAASEKAAAELAQARSAEAAGGVQIATLTERLTGSEKNAQRLEKAIADAAKSAGQQTPTRMQ